MAKKSKIAAQKRREVLVARHAERRAELRAIRKDESRSLEERMAATRELSRLPRDSSPVRLRNRDAIDGRPRGFVGKAGISRVRFREMAHRGELPGITKSSW
ncbi:MAG: 30S ribosomal protein S14 [Acidipropionibacterium sp.]|jgi:small subunit ribosomal protein S14|nr:30S ribosomal protein S14 [Acidipropionibacterium sp.]